MESPEKRLESLLDVMLDATASDAQRQEFASLIEGHTELVSPFIIQLRTHSLLQWQCDEVKSGIAHASEAVQIGLKPSGARRAAARFIGRMAAIAAALLIAGGAIFALIQAWQTGNHFAIAELVEDKGVVWADTTTALEEGRLIRPGRLDIESGSATLRFRSGVTVELREAAATRIESDMLILLDRGQATAQVPHWAKGFTIETADVEVVDLGTQFGVVALGGGMTDVVIFEGQVDLKPIQGSRRFQKRLNQGEAARINRNGTINRIVEVRSNANGDWSTTNHSGHHVFKAIRDNIPPSDGSKYYYYQITTTGMDDDAWAYVDGHPHQWNGLTARGLPEFLRGADYARTFNDYRYIQDFEIVVELSTSANLYVFFDDRVPTPDWLLERFEDTGVNIGLDEGPWEGIPHHRHAVGAGNSIDNVFSVWRRRCERGELVTLGAVGESSEARAMYGIAATPLDSGEPAD
jgi:hypothetical protein